MSPVADHLVIMKNNDGQTYIPDYGINNIGSIDYKQGYQAYMDQAATLTVEGAYVDPTTPISLAVGWSMIAYLPGSAMDAATALTSIATQLVLAKDNAGQTYIPDYGINNIGQMQPGQGYQVYLDGAGTLTYPVGVPAKSNEYLLKSLVQHFQFTSNTGDNATIVVPEAANPQYSDGSPLGMGDEIGVFTSAGLCCGAVVWNGENIAITVWGDDSQTPQTDGFTAGDGYHFRVWKMSTNTEYIANAAFQPGHPGVYGTNNYSVVTELITDLNTSGGYAGALRPTEYRLFANHPNPFNPSTKIRFALPKSGHVIVKIFDLRGKEIQTLVNGRMPEGEHEVEWDARDLPSGIYFCRMEAGGFVDTRKLVLQK
jgi:hypothetical protein